MTILQLSQETGIGIDTLRIWERRYGYPIPQRNARGHRRYSAKQVEELRIVRKLQNRGQRPGKIFALSAAERQILLQGLIAEELPEIAGMEHFATELTIEEIEREMCSRLRQLGLIDFVHQFALPLIQLLDRGWSEGSISIAREHLISDRLERLLETQFPPELPENGPRMLFLTLSGERHKLGLLMAATIFGQQGIDCILLQEEPPITEIPELAKDLSVAAVALSFSAHYSSRQAKHDLATLRGTLPQDIKLIAGGQAVKRDIRLPNLIICKELRDIPDLCRKYFITQA
jgi:DNA-binding transcriptional MerR regulator